MTSETLTGRRSQILQATLDLVAERGLLNTTVALIARQAKSSPGIIYHYFESKEQILHSLYENILHEYAGALMAGDPLAQDALGRYKTIWLKTYGYFVSHPKQASFLEQYKSSAYAQFNQSVESDPHLAPLIQAVRRDIASGLVKDLPLDVIYALTVDVAKSLAKLHTAGLVHLDAAQLDEIAQASCRVLIG